MIAPQAAGGAESVVRALARAGNNSALTSEVVALVPPGAEHPFVTDLSQDGTRVHAVACPHRRYLTHVRRLASALETLRPDVVHTHMYHADVIGYFAAHGRVPIVSTVHGITGAGRKNAAYLWLDFRVLRRFDGVACVTDALRGRLVASGCDARRLLVVPNGHVPQDTLTRAAAREALGIPVDATCLGWVGRLSPEKGPDTFIEAVTPHVGGNVCAVLIGEGPDQEALARQVERAGLSGVVRLVGRKPSAASLLRAFDGLVLSSRSEASPVVILEAMGARVPIVAFGVGSVPDVLEPEAAWLVEPEDLVGLSAAIGRLLADPDGAGRRAEAARAIVRERYGADQWVSRMESLYDLAIGNLR